MPTGIATDDSTKGFFSTLIGKGSLVRLLSLYEVRGWFKGTDDRKPFCMLTIGQAKSTDFLFDAKSISDFSQKEKWFRLSREDFHLLNPNTLTCPVFRSERDAELTKKFYRASPVLIAETSTECNPWGIKFSQGLFNMTSDSHLFADYFSPGWVPLYEAKMTHQFDHRWASYGRDGICDDVSVDQKKAPDFSVTPRHWVESAEVESRLVGKNWDRGWLMGWRDIALRSVERTVIASIVPRVGVGHKMPLMFAFAAPSVQHMTALYGNLNALVLDYVARQKIGGTSLTYFYLKQFPMLPPERYSDVDFAFIVPRVLELTYTAYDLKPWAEDLGYNGAPFPWNPERRAQLRAELDAYYARLYDLTRDELCYILDPADVLGEDYPSETFRVLKNNEIREFGEYRTRRLILEAWDRLAAEQSDALASTAVFSEQGLIRNADEADFAGIVIEVIKQYPDGLAAGDLQALVAYALQPTIVSQFADQATAARLTELMSKICRIDVGGAIQLIPNVLHRLQTTGVCRSTKRGDAVVYTVGTGVPPADVRCTQEHAELGTLLLALDMKRKANAQAGQTGQQSTDTQRGVA